MIATAVTAMFGLQHPIVLAPMGGVSGGVLAAAVSNAGGLGLVGAGYGDIDWLHAELAHVRRETTRPWGVGLITWSVDTGLVEEVLSQRPAALMLSFGDPRPHGRLAKAAGCKLICQVQDLDDLAVALEAGADLIVAQGTEGGGHGGRRATLPLVPAVVDAARGTPVLAAGGIADGRGLAAALMLGAEGALIGTRFYASDEALGFAQAKRLIASASGGQTERTRLFDVVRRLGWPERFTGRALRNPFIERWRGQDAALAAALDGESPAFRSAAKRGDLDTMMVWAGEAVDLISSVEPAAALVERIATEAEACLARGSRMRNDR